MATRKELQKLWYKFWHRWGIVYCGHVDNCRILTWHGYFCGFTIWKSCRAYIIMPLNRLAEWCYNKRIKSWGSHAKVR
jgi:hypothetical protein